MRSLLSPLARPAHTGASRCWPCTVANLLILAGGCLALAVVSVPASAGLAVVGVAAVRLRGYLVPDTPTLAPLVVERLSSGRDSSAHSGGSAPSGPPPRADGGSRSGRDPPDDRSDQGTTGDADEIRAGTLADATEEDGAAVLETLLSAGVLDEADDGDVEPASAFAERWHDEMRLLRTLPTGDLAAVTLAETPAARASESVTERDRTYVVLSDGSDDPAGEVWIRRPVAVAEAAAARALADAGIEVDERVLAAHALGVFLDACPTCDAPLVERPAGGCCGPPQTDAEGHPLQALVCEDCRARFAVFD